MAYTGVVSCGDAEDIDEIPDKDNMDDVTPPGPDNYDGQYDVEYYSTEPTEDRIQVIPGGGGGAATVTCDGKGVTIAGQEGSNRVVIVYDRKWNLGPYPWPPDKDPTKSIKDEIAAVNADKDISPEDKKNKIKELNEQLKAKQEEIAHIKWVTGSFTDTEKSREEYALVTTGGSSSIFAEGQPLAGIGDKVQVSIIITDYDDEGNVIGSHTIPIGETKWKEGSKDVFKKK